MNIINPTKNAESTTESVARRYMVHFICLVIGCICITILVTIAIIYIRRRKNRKAVEKVAVPVNNAENGPQNSSNENKMKTAENQLSQQKISNEMKINQAKTSNETITNPDDMTSAVPIHHYEYLNLSGKEDKDTLNQSKRVQEEKKTVKNNQEKSAKAPLFDTRYWNMEQTTKEKVAPNLNEDQNTSLKSKTITKVPLDNEFIIHDLTAPPDERLITKKVFPHPDPETFHTISSVPHKKYPKLKAPSDENKYRSLKFDKELVGQDIFLINDHKIKKVKDSPAFEKSDDTSQRFTSDENSFSKKAKKATSKYL